mgnify:CR=1 FL=1
MKKRALSLFLASMMMTGMVAGTGGGRDKGSQICIFVYRRWNELSSDPAYQLFCQRQ